jgi:hypothetical protein
MWRNYPEINQEEALELARKRAEGQWQDSLRRTDENDPKSRTNPEGPILFEHYFKHLRGTIELNTICEDILNNILSFFSWFDGNELNQRLKTASNNWIEHKSIGFLIGDIKFLTKIDLAAQFTDEFIIVDWKTGKLPQGDFKYRPERKQISTYALWPYLEMEIPIEQISLYVVYLGNPDRADALKVEIKQEEVPEILDEAALCIEAGGDVLESKEIYKLEDFDYATSLITCEMCPFQEICWESLSESYGE